MGKLQEFLTKEYDKAPVRDEVMIKPFPFPFVIHSIKQAENKEIENSCKRTTFNKKTHEKEVETDRNLYCTRLIVACCDDPNFRDADFQAAHGVMGAEALVETLLDGGAYAELLRAVSEINGFGTDINDLVEEAKN